MPFYALHWQERRSNIAIALIHQPNIALDLCPFPKQVATHATLSRDSILKEAGRCSPCSSLLFEAIYATGHPTERVRETSGETSKQTTVDIP